MVRRRPGLEVAQERAASLGPYMQSLLGTHMQLGEILRVAVVLLVQPQSRYTTAQVLAPN